MSGHLFRIAALSLAIVAGLAVPPMSEDLVETARSEAAAWDDTRS